MIQNLLSCPVNLLKFSSSHSLFELSPNSPSPNVELNTITLKANSRLYSFICSYDWGFLCGTKLQIVDSFVNNKDAPGFPAGRLVVIIAGIIPSFSLSPDLSLNFQSVVARASAVVGGQNDGFFQAVCQSDRRRRKARTDLIEGRPKAGFILWTSRNRLPATGMARLSHLPAMPISGRRCEALIKDYVYYDGDTRESIVCFRTKTPERGIDNGISDAICC